MYIVGSSETGIGRQVWHVVSFEKVIVHGEAERFNGLNLFQWMIKEIDRCVRLMVLLDREQ